MSLERHSYVNRRTADLNNKISRFWTFVKTKVNLALRLHCLHYTMKLKIGSSSKVSVFQLFHILKSVTIGLRFSKVEKLSNVS